MAESTWEFEWPQSNNPQAPEAGTKVVLLEPGEALVDKAFKLAKPFEKQGRYIHGHKAELELLRLCLKRVGDRRFTYADLEGEKLEQELNAYERRMLSSALDKLTTPEDSEVESFLDTASLSLTTSKRKPKKAEEGEEQ